MGMKYLFLMYQSIVHSRREQLLHRLHLVVKRAVLSRFTSSAFKQWVALPKSVDLKISESPPNCLFEPRADKVCAAGPENLEIGFLGIWKAFTLPLEWHASEMKSGTRLWLLNLHYMEFLEGVEQAIWFDSVKDWIIGNRPYERGYWLDSWNSYSLSIRTVVWMQEYQRRGQDNLLSG